MIPTPSSNNVRRLRTADCRVVDPNIMNWVDKTYTDNGYNNKTSLWSISSVISRQVALPTWGINLTLLGNSLANA